LTPLRALLYTSPWWLDGKIDIKRLTRTAQPKTKIFLLYSLLEHSGSFMNDKSEGCDEVQ